MINVSNSSAKDWVLLIVAIALTVLFLVFAEPVYTALYLGSDEFADAMYDFKLYFPLAMYTMIVVWCVAILYYWVIDKVALSSFAWWAVSLLVAVGVSTAITYFYPMGVFDAENLDFVADMTGMTAVGVAISLVFYVIVSICIKGLSTNCTTRPF